MEKTSDDWGRLREVLLTSTLLPWSNKELLYLQNAFFDIEDKWQAALDAIEKPSFILLGEAPLYGKDCSYIYSLCTPPTAFLRPTDLPKFCDQKVNNDKAYMLDAMRDFGIIVIDLFPYALNEHDTPTMNYKKIQNKPVYTRLLRNSFENFTKTKILKVMSQSPDATVLIRYKRIMKHVEPLMQSLGIKNGLKKGDYTCIGSNNMGVDKNMLWSALNEAKYFNKSTHNL